MTPCWRGSSEGSRKGSLKIFRRAHCARRWRLFRISLTSRKTKNMGGPLFHPKGVPPYFHPKGSLIYQRGPSIFFIPKGSPHIFHPKGVPPYFSSQRGPPIFFIPKGSPHIFHPKGVPPYFSSQRGPPIFFIPKGSPHIFHPKGVPPYFSSQRGPSIFFIPKGSPHIFHPKGPSQALRAWEGSLGSTRDGGFHVCLNLYKHSEFPLKYYRLFHRDRGRAFQGWK